MTALGRMVTAARHGRERDRTALEKTNEGGRSSEIQVGVFPLPEVRSFRRLRCMIIQRGVLKRTIRQ